MKYVLSILLLAVLFTITVGVYIFPKKIPLPDPGLEINGRIVSAEEIDKYYSDNSYGTEDLQQFLESLITRELLIQEARSINLDQEEDFRQSLQNFYEQSLTKVLLQRKHEQFKYTPTPQETARFIELQGYQVELTMLPRTSQAGENKPIKAAYRNLATSMQVALITVTVGRTSEPIQQGELGYALRLDKLSKLPAENNDFSMTPDEAKQIIALEHQQQSLANWLDELRKQAVVKGVTAMQTRLTKRNTVE